ncbi:transcriptional regulator, MerR family [Oscillatoria nigro-viridis PCC 7112]|uniref:Transcriptional regulator, MerR family n=1 Tax=Phormidium nigroviride PCC 7112 TaxID=179408 RepID=K9VI74_9CYAN|nr:heavy metal-responsive transcriptional regulator [Oscillatoria nigro-viridis]AFZ07214.1 transcriptional regulator, MerR family [Oscillatoria nigro-viridis PCC 7112]
MLVQEKQKLIGLVAKESGVPIKTIRYYEELGLIKASGRTEGKYRLFNSDILNRLSFIKRAQTLGLTLAEIQELLTVHDGGELPCEHIKVQLRDKLSVIDRQIQQLLILKLELEGLLSGSPTLLEKVDSIICPLIQKN